MQFEDLIKQGVDFNYRLDDVNKRTALMQIVQSFSPSSKNLKCKIMQLIIDSGADVNLTDKNGKTALCYSVFHETSKILIENGADLSIRDKDGNTALMNTSSSSWKHIQLLIQNGIDVNVQNKSGYSFIMDAVRYFELEKVEYLVDNGADVFSVTKSGINVLMFSSKPEITEYLINLGLNVNSADNVRRTPLHHVILRSKDKDIVEVLLKYNADINARDWQKKTPLITSVRSGNTEITRLLLEKGAEYNTEEMFIRFARARKLDKDFGNFLLKQNVDINLKDKDGKTALIHSVSRGRYKITRFLLENGAFVNTQDNNGKSAIFYAVGFPSHKKSLELLLSFGADVNVKDKSNKTPLHYAKEYCDSTIVNMLLDAQKK